MIESMMDGLDISIILCVLLMILSFTIHYYLLYYTRKQRPKQRLGDTEDGCCGPPDYDEVIKKDEDNLESLPSYLEAVRLESEKTTEIFRIKAVT